MSGWVCIHRKVMEHPLYFSEPFTKMQAWFDLILLANHKEGIVQIRGIIFPVKRGQLAWASETLASRWKWSRGKVDRYLNYLKLTGQIEHQKSKLTTCITILNYNNYQNIVQQKEQQTDNKRTSNGQQTNINNSVNNDNTVVLSVDNNTEPHISLDDSILKQSSPADGNPGGLAIEQPIPVGDRMDQKAKPVKKPKEPKPAVEISNEFEGLTEVEIESWKVLVNWMKGNDYTRVQKLEKPLTPHQLAKLLKKYTGENIKSTFIRMENWKPLSTKAVSAYDTLRVWMDKDLKKSYEKY